MASTQITSFDLLSSDLRCFSVHRGVVALPRLARSGCLALLARAALGSHPPAGVAGLLGLARAEQVRQRVPAQEAGEDFLSARPERDDPVVAVMLRLV